MATRFWVSAVDAALPVYATWNPGDLTDIVLTNGNLSAKRSPVGSGYRAVRATTALSGNAYWEVTVNWGGSVGYRGGIGIATAALPTSSSSVYVGGSGTTSAGTWNHSNVVYYNGSAVTNVINSSISSDTVYMFAFKPSTRELWIGTTVIGWYNGGDPAAGTSPTVTVGDAGPYFPVVGPGNSQSPPTFTANFGATSFAGTVPSGFASGVFS